MLNRQQHLATQKLVMLSRHLWRPLYSLLNSITSLFRTQTYLQCIRDLLPPFLENFFLLDLAGGAGYPVQKYRTRSNCICALQISLSRQISITNSICNAEEICNAISTSTMLLHSIQARGSRRRSAIPCSCGVETA